MCGIGGFIKEGNVEDEFLKNLIRGLALQLQSRGQDATGVYTSIGQGIVHKAPGPASGFRNWPEQYGQVTLVHARAATHGTPRNNHNNHPIIGLEKVLIHNGIVWGEKLNDYPYKGECDSEILLSYIERFGINEGLKKSHGSIAVAFCDMAAPKKLWLYSYSSPLWLAYVPKWGVLFGSTKEIVRLIVKRHWSKWLGIFMAGALYEVDDNELLELDLETMTFKTEKIAADHYKGLAGIGHQSITRSIRNPQNLQCDGSKMSSSRPYNLIYNHIDICDFCHRAMYVRPTRDNKRHICEQCDLSAKGDKKK